MKINQTSGYEVVKELSQMQGNSFQLEDITSAVQRTYAKPKLLTALLGVMDNEEFMMTDTFKFDEVQAKIQLPSGKAFSDVGKDLDKDTAKEFRYSIPSFGLKLQVAPSDYVGRRIPGTAGELMTEDYVLGRMTVAAEDSWAMLDELGMAQLITTDTNIVRGGPFESYNFYTDIVGGARPAKIDMDLGNGAIDHIAEFRKQRKLLLQELARANDSSSKIICICGDTFFQSRYEIEKQEGVQRDLRSTLDLVSMAIPTISDGNFLYDNFESHDGITYINYGSEIIAGTKLIGDDDAYLIPLGASNLIRVAYAPAQTRTYVNTQAQQSYAWSHVDERQGITIMQESNKLFSLISPKSITHLTSTTAP